MWTAPYALSFYRFKTILDTSKLFWTEPNCSKCEIQWWEVVFGLLKLKDSLILLKSQPYLPKGQLISKVLFGILNSPWKQTIFFYFTTMIPQVNFVLSVFWEKLKKSKRYFEINWPLAVKFVFSEKAAKIDKIFTVDLTLTT